MADFNPLREYESGLRGAFIDQREDEPVSYTHLTLPTKA